MSRPASGGWLEQAQHFLDAQATRLLLSLLIILSILPATTLHEVMPPAQLALLDLVFLAIFAPEFVVRLLLFVRHLRQGEPVGGELLLLGADLLALVSFLPLHGLADAGYLRLFRLTRLLLLFGYWGGTVRDFSRILGARERRAQVLFVLLLGAVFSFAGAVLLHQFAPAYDYDDNGTLDGNDRAFPLVLWWSFRQVQDAGNLVAHPGDLLVVAVSLVLTFVGVLLFSFVIGIASGAMDELMRRARERSAGLRDHTVVLGVGPYTALLLDELAQIYRKNLGVARVAVLGDAPTVPDYFHQKSLRSFHYRSGSPYRADDLHRVDIERAKRVLIQSTGGDDSDAQVVSAVLAVRARTTRASLFPDLEHERNFLAARTAGGPRTRLIGWGPFLGYYTAENVVYPGIYHLYRALLTTSGCEIYTYLYDGEEHRRLGAAFEPAGLDPALLCERAFREGVVLLGVFLQNETADDDLQTSAVLLNPASAEARTRHPEAFHPDGRLRWPAVRGLIGVCVRWRDLARLAQELRRVIMEPSAAPAPSSFDGLRLVEPLPRPERVLICGSSARVPRVVSELIQFYGRLTVTVLVRDAANVGPLAYDVEAALEGYLSGLPSGEGAAWTVEERTEGREMRLSADEGQARIRVVNLDWSDATRLLRDPSVDLAGTDVVLFMPREDRADDRDGLVALDCLRLAHFGASGMLRFRPGFRVVGLMNDPVKTDLLENRLDQMSGPGAETRFTIISSERIRNHFLVQNLFVRGLNPVFLQVLGLTGQHLRRVLPRGADGKPPAGHFQAAVLAQALRARDMVLVGLEEDGGRGRTQATLDPRELLGRGDILWSGVRALYVLSERSTG